MKTFKLFTAVASAAAILTIPMRSSASVSVQNYSAPSNSTYTLTEDASLYVSPQDPTWTGGRLFFGAMYNYVHNPLVELNADRTARLSTIVNSIQTLDMTAGWTITRRVSIDATLPLNLVRRLDSATNQFSLGDARLFSKIRLTTDDAWMHVALIPEVIFPTGAQDLFLSSGGFGGGARLSMERDFGPLTASINMGYRYRGNAVFGDLDYTHSIPLALGLFIPVGQSFGINAEAAGSVLAPLNRFQNPGEAYVGGRYRFNREAVINLGAAIGSISPIGSNDFRVIAGVQFSPMPKEQAPIALPVVAVVTPVDPKVELKKQVVFTPKEIQLGQEVKFEHGKDRLTDSGKQLLDAVAEVLQENKGSYRRIIIEGHTNDIGSFKFNLKLSQARAIAVREYLISRGIQASVLNSTGYGKTRPKYLPGMSHTAQLEANRRVEFKVIQDKKKKTSTEKSTSPEAKAVKPASQS